MFNVRFTEVAGKCYLAYSENLSESVEEWSAGGPYRFYFTEAYNAKEKTFDEPPYNIINMGKPGKGKGKGKQKTKTAEDTENKPVINKPTVYPAITRKLRTLDIFSGCGGEYSRFVVSTGTMLLKVRTIATKMASVQQDCPTGCTNREYPRPYGPSRKMNRQLTRFV